MDSLKQDVNGNRNRVLSLNPENKNPNRSKMTTNIYHQQNESEIIYQRKTHQIISLTVLAIVVLLLILICIIMVRLTYIDISINHLLND